MWSSIKNGSKKNLVMVLTVVALLANHFLGAPLPEALVLTLVGFAATWMVARGIADHGAGGSVRDTVHKGSEVYGMVKQIMDTVKDPNLQVRVRKEGTVTVAKVEERDIPAESGGKSTSE